MPHTERRDEHEGAAVDAPLHMLGEHPTLQPCCGPFGSTRRLSSRRPSSRNLAGFVMTSSNRSASFWCCGGEERARGRLRRSASRSHAELVAEQEHESANEELQRGKGERTFMMVSM